MTTKDEEEPRISSLPPVSRPSMVAGHRRLSIWSSMTGGPASLDPACNWSSLVSALVALNTLLLGCAMVSASVFNTVSITSTHLQLYLITIMILSTCWMLYYTLYTVREHCAVLYKDGHAGPIWLRGGLILFGLCSIIMDIFKIANYVGYLHCDSPVKIVFPIVQAVFILVQSYFLWLHAKDCVQLQRNVTRGGLMLTLSTNLMLWMTAVTEESLHQTVLPQSNGSKASHRTAMRVGPMDDCECSHSACSIFEQASNYLYPFNIEYSLFASAMTYVMWKNVGRLVDGCHHHRLRFHLRDVLLGPISGLLVLVAGLVTFIMYKVDVQDKDPAKRDLALRMHYIMNSLAYVLMSAATVAGWVLFGLDRREYVSGKNPTRSLDVGLLLGASMGQFAICYFTIVAVVATGVQSEVDALNLASALLAIVQLCLQNGFIVEGLHRLPHEPTPAQTNAAPELYANVHATRSHSDSELDIKPDPIRISTVSQSHHCPTRLCWKRRALKEVCAYLMLCNITLWIMPAFGARPQFENPHGLNFYQVYMWVAVMNIGLPFSIFYRMHSVAGLFEVYVTS
ncbi:proton channel OTOP2 [Alosa sapidissima]|uniref:proton channel OTOP2 n=1 Tax=Alosa sapidissima TaxID=34773 RepID=UPI001C095D22|nr:proton channel OTOP2 [Alosa sapidissima]